MVRGNAVFAKILERLGHETAGPAGQGEHAPGIAAEDDAGFPKVHGGGGSIGVVDHLRGHLRGQSELIGGDCAGWQHPDFLFAGDGSDDGIGACANVAQNGVPVRYVIEAASDPPNRTVTDQAGERHANGTGVSDIGKIARCESPTVALGRNTAEHP